MRPIFTVHAGEFIVGEFIEKNFPDLNVWIPSKDTGIDLLVTDKRNTTAVTIQVKLSRDYRPIHAKDDFDRLLVAGGWLTLSHKKIANSSANYWVIVLVSHERKIEPQYIVIPPGELLKRLEAIHGSSNIYQVYPWVTKSGVAIDGRGLSKDDRLKFATDQNKSLEFGPRDLSGYLNNWSPLERISDKS